MAISSGQAAYKLSFQLAPIFLVGGVASLIPGGILPLLSITQAIDFTTGLLGSGDTDLDLDSFFANFQPLPGSTLIDNQVGNYPFANQAVAANAIIAQPLFISMLMLCPAGRGGGYLSKLSTMMAIQATLKQHNSSEGTYTVATPAFLYTNLIMTSMKDVTNAQTKQVQMAYQMDFVKPLLTLEDAEQAQNNLMSQITNGTQINGQPAWSGYGTSAGSTYGATNPTPSVVPAGQGIGGIGHA